jgi:hypothetical protein
MKVLDLLIIDFSKKPHHNYKDVPHINGCFSKYTTLYAYHDKAAAVVEDHIANRIVCLACLYGAKGQQGSI